MLEHTQRKIDQSSVPLSPAADISLLQGILNASPGCVAFCEPVRLSDASVEAGQVTDFVFRIINTRMSELIGLSLPQIPGRRLTDVAPSITTNGLFDRYVTALETGQPASFEQLVRSGSVDGWYLISVESLSTGLVISLIDITDRKQAELRARYQTDEIQATLDASLNSILLMRALRNSDGKIIDFRMERANQAVINSLFKTPDELEGKNLLDVFPGNVDSGFFDLYASVADSGTSKKAEYYYQDVNDFRGWFEVSAVQQDVDLIVLTFNNITAQREEQLAQQHQAQVLQAILDHSQTAISLHEPVRDSQGTIIDFRVVQANRQAIINWGSLADTILNQSFLTIRPDAHDTDEFARYVRVITTGEPETFDFTYDRRQFLITIACAGSNIVMSAVDVTSDRQYRHELETLNRSLQQSNESLQSFAYVASHDLQEPLRKIQAFGDILQSQFQDNLSDGERDMTRRIQKSAKRMQQLVKDLLAYSQVTTRREPLVSVSLDEVVSDVISDLEVSIADANATIQLSPLPTLPGNASRLRQLMQNLIANAIKFRQPTRPLVVQISSRLAEASELPGGLVSSVAYWLITVTDNGLGFDEKYKDRIFQLFQRLHDATSYSGTGIGLAICQRVVESHDGAIDVRSQPGEGTTFSVFLPAHQPAS